MVDRRVFAHLPVLHGAEHGIQFIELDLLDMHLTQEVAGKGVQLLGGLHQPVQHGVGGHLKDPGSGANPQTLRQARQHPDDQLHGDLLAMQERAMMLREIPLARGALELAPGAAIGMAVGAQIAPPEPAAIATARVGTEVLRGVHSTRTSGGRRHGVRWHWRRRLGKRGLSLTQSARRPLGQSSKRLGLLGTCTFGLERLARS